MKVIILAGGEGTRMRKIFPGMPKGLIRIKGKPIVEHLIKQFKDFEVFLNVRAKDEARFRYLDVPLLIEEKPLGNAGAIKKFKKDLGRRFIAVHVDTYSNLDPHALTKFHKGTATMMVKNIARPKDFGIITYEENLVTGFTRERFVNCGIYVFSGDIVDYIGKGFQDLDKDVFPKLITKRKLRFYRHDGQWHDIGREEFWSNEHIPSTNLLE